MRKLIFISCLWFCFFNAFSQNFNSLKQIKGSETYLKDVLSLSPSNSPKSKYVVLLTPMSCPRCEAAINPSINQIREKDSLAEVILVVNYPRKKVVLDYLKKREISVNHVIVDNGSFVNSFVFSTGTPIVPYILKINTDGKLLQSIALIGNIETEKLINDNSPNKTHKGNRKKPLKQIDITRTFDDYEVVPLDELTSPAISIITFPFVDSENSLLFFSDDITLCIFIFDIKRGLFLTKICSNDSINKVFSPDMNDNVYKEVKEMGLINPMFFKTNRAEGSKYYISSSLPKIIKMNKEKSWGSMNEASYLEYNCTSNKIEKVVSFDFTNLVQSLSPDHTSSFFSLYDNKFYLPLDKGIPNVGNSMRDTVGGNNPFIESFYDNSPLFAIFNKNGEFVMFFGKIDNFFIKNKLGYSLVYPKIFFHKDAYFTTTSTSKVIYKYDREYNVVDSIILKDYFKDTKFIEKRSKKPKVKETFEYLLSFDSRFGAFIHDFKFDENLNKLYVLWLINDEGYYGSVELSQYVYQVYEKDQKDKYIIKSETKLPNHYDGMKIQESKLDDTGKPYGIYQDIERTELLFFKEK